MARSGCEEGEKTVFFAGIYENKQLDGENILDSFNYNTNLEIGIENINNKTKIHQINIIYIAQFYAFGYSMTEKYILYFHYLCFLTLLLF